MKRLFLTLPLLLLFAVPLASTTPIVEPSLFASIKPLQMIYEDPDTHISTLRNMCTVGSMNAEEHLWLTAAHCVVDPAEGPEGPAAPRPRYIMGDEVTKVAVDEKVDLAILRTERAVAPALALATTPPTYGDDLILIGHPFGFRAPIVTFGTVANPAMIVEDGEKEYMLYTTPAAPGNSGSPVLDRFGRVVSVLQVGWGRVFGPVVGGATFEQLRKFTIGYWGLRRS